MAIAGVLPSVRMESAGCTDTGCVRKNNEDSFRCDDALGLYLVADGMGGAQAGEHASRLAADAVVSHVATGAPSSAHLLTAVSQANHAVLDAARTDSRLQGMGTTLVAALISGADLLVASVGDSRAYALTEGQPLRALTEDQTWVHEIGRLQLGLDEEALKRHNMRHVLTMAVGVGETLRVNSYRYPIDPRTVIMLCSDGLHGVVPEPAIEAALRAETPLEERCRQLVELARQHGGPDNITVVLLRPLAPA